MIRFDCQRGLAPLEQRRSLLLPQRTKPGGTPRCRVPLGAPGCRSLVTLLRSLPETQRPIRRWRDFGKVHKGLSALEKQWKKSWIAIFEPPLKIVLCPEHGSKTKTGFESALSVCTSHIFQLAWHGSSAQICRRSEESDGGMAWMAWMAWAVATWLRISLDLHCFALFGLWCHSCIIIIIFIGILVMFLEKEKQTSGLRRVQLLSKVDPLLTHSWPFSHIFAEGSRAKGQRDALKAVSTLSLVSLLLFCDVLCMMPSTRSPWHVHNKSERIQMYLGYISNCLTGGSSRASCCEAWGSQPPKFVSLGILAMRSESAKPRGLTKLSFECNCLPMSSWSWPPFGALQSEQSEHPRKLSNFPKPKIPSLQALAQNIPCSPREVTRQPRSRGPVVRCMIVVCCALSCVRCGFPSVLCMLLSWSKLI